ncbi:MAG: acylneuraminate cytidylyltransferase family protein [Rhodospirillales bacterium]|nr:acylneuraminate cytidylyltransferase family protein [Rhodospirillales bacterium]
MIGNKRVLTVVPARGGSKGIPLKNLRPVQGIPLVALVGHLCAKVPEITRAVVSTDHEEIARVAEESGLAAPFRRPEAIAGDRIGDWDVLSHALVEMEKLDNTRYDIVVMLQPTSPMRTPENVSNTIHMLVDGSWDAVWTVSETDGKSHPLKQLVLKEDNTMDYYDPKGSHIIARQQLKPVYHRNGIAYAITRDCLLEQNTIKGKRTGALIIDGHHVSIDTEWDLQFVNYLLSQNQLQNTYEKNNQ